MASARSLRGLDWLNFFVANVQTGFGPFIAVYLTTKAWTQTEIGEALSLGTVVAMISQVPGGAIVDRLRDKRLAAATAGVAVAISAVLFAAIPSRPAVMLAEALHSFASTMLSPALAAISLALIGRATLGERLGRNARFASLGNGIAAGIMGVCGAYVSSRAVFWLTAALMIPGLIALAMIEKAETPREDQPARGKLRTDLFALLRTRRVLAFAASAALFQLANAALLPLVGTEVTQRAGGMANLVIAACIMLPQALVALVSPLVGRAADRAGPRRVLLLGFAAIPLRALLMAMISNPALLIAVQTLDGVSAAVFGVMLPLIAADLTMGTERFNLCMGVFGLASSAGATISALVGGMIADEFGHEAAFLILAGCGVAATLSVLAAAPQSRA